METSLNENVILFYGENEIYLNECNMKNENEWKFSNKT
jgi:hypothetical protein